MCCKGRAPLPRIHTYGKIYKSDERKKKKFGKVKQCGEVFKTLKRKLFQLKVKLRMSFTRLSEL